MSPANVLPIAPPQSDTEKQPLTYQPLLYLVLKTQPENFRMDKITEIEKQIADEAAHYRHVAKKCKKAHSVLHGSAIGLGSISAELSTAGLATSLADIGIIVGAPLTAIGALCGFSSTGLTAASKRLEAKVAKHEKIWTLAVDKRDSINEIVSKAAFTRRTDVGQLVLANSNWCV